MSPRERVQELRAVGVALAKQHLMLVLEEEDRMTKRDLRGTRSLVRAALAGEVDPTDRAEIEGLWRAVHARHAGGANVERMASSR